MSLEMKNDPFAVRGPSDGPSASPPGAAGGGVQILQQAPDAEATFYSLPFIEALRACTRQWNATAGGTEVQRGGSTAGGVAGQGTGSHVLTQDHLAVEAHYEEYYAARHLTVMDSASAGAAGARGSHWPVPVHTAPLPPPASQPTRASLGMNGEAAETLGGRGSRRTSAAEASAPAALPTGSTSPSQASARRRSSNAAGTEASAVVPEELDLTTPMGVAWMRATASPAEGPSAHPEAGTPLAQSHTADADAEAAAALRALHAGLRRALGFPAKDEGLLAVDDLLLGCRSQTLASYAKPQRTSAREAATGASHAPVPRHHVDAAHGVRAGTQDGAPAVDNVEETEEAATTLVLREVPDDAWRAASLPVPPTVTERTPHLAVWCSEEGDDALRESAVLEWFSEVLEFADRRTFSTVQTRCLLLDAVGLVETLYEIFHALDNDDEATAAAGQTATDVSARLRAEDALVEEAITTCLQDALSAQACPVTMRVVERQPSERPVSREVPDPAVVAPLERRLATEKLNKKQQQQLREQIEHAPRITQTEVERVIVEAERDITVGPYFNLQETAAILAHLTASVGAHWRLWRLLLSTAQPQHTTTYTMVYEDVAPFCVPPLSEFTADSHYGEVLAHHALYVEACCTLDDAFDALVAAPLRAMEADKQLALEAMRAAQRRDQQANHANTLSAEEFDKVERAFLTRLNQKLARHPLMAANALAETMPTGEALAEVEAARDFAATAPTADAARRLTPTPPPTGSAKGAKGKAGKRATSTSQGGARGKAPSSLGATLEASRVGAESVVLPSDAVFSIDEVEQRVTAAQANLDAKLETAAATTKKKGK